MTTSWYGKSQKQLEPLLQSKPKLLQLFMIPDFLQQLKSYNTKLLEYVTTTPALIGEAIELITVPPLNSDSHDRKYKHPLQVIEMIETETTCVLNAFFKNVTQNNSNVQYFDLMFDCLGQGEIMPLLAGYFFRTNICLLNNRYKQTLDRIYTHPQFLFKLLDHCTLMPLCNTIQLYINLDINKSSDSDPTRLQTKKELLKKIITKIGYEQKHKQQDSVIIVENLMTIIIETIEKYYLILDGKTMVEVLTAQTTIDTMLTLIKENWEGAYPGFSFFISLINYYSFSSFNADEPDEEKRVKNLQRLETQPMVVALRGYFATAMDKIMKAQTFTLYEYKLLQVLCHCISISSEEIFQIIKETRFFANLITLLFKHEHNNILHMLIEKSFLHVFISERKIYERYKRHLFCEIDIIELTAGRVMAVYDEAKVFEVLRRKMYFGHFMRILKIYSGIQTTEEGIINAIKAKTDVWNKVSSCLIKPYETICFKELGTYENIPEGSLQQYEVSTRGQQISANMLVNPKPLTRSMIEEIRKEDELLPMRKESEMTDKSLPSTMKEEIIEQKRKEEQLLKSPTHNLTVEFKSMAEVQNKEIKKVESFKDFMSKKKVEAEKEIKMKRSLSHEKRLSGSKGKIVGMSPKKNSWTEKEDGEQAKMSSSTVVNGTKGTSMPRIPPYIPSLPSSTKQPAQLSTSPHISPATTKQGYRSYYGSSIAKTSPQLSRNRDHNNKQQLAATKLETRSEMSFEMLKKIKVIRIEAPKEKRYRRLEEKDKVLLDFLGIVSK